MAWHGIVLFVSWLAMGEVVDGGNNDAQSPTAEGDSQAPSQVEDFDLAFDDHDRKLRMKSCFMLAFNKLRQDGNDEIKQMAREIKQMARAFMKLQDMTEEQATHQIIVARVMNCYMYIQPEEQHMIQSGADLSTSSVKAIFGDSRQVAQKPSQASKRQWLLLDSVMKEDMKTVKDEQSSKARANRKMAELEQQLADHKKWKSEQAETHDNVSVGGGSRWKRTLYVLGVLSAVFGPLVFILWRLLRRESVVAKAKAHKGEKGKQKR